MSTEPLGDTIQPLTLSDTVYTWYNTTNEIIDLVNPLNIYDVVPENGISYTRSGISEGILTFSVNLKNTGGLIFDNITGGIRLSTQNLTLESFASASSYKLFAEDSAGNIKAVSFDLNAGTGISFDDNTGSMTIGVNDDVVLLTKVQTLTNKSLVAPKIVNSTTPTGTITLLAPTNIGSYSLTFPTSEGSSGQYLSVLNDGELVWVDAPSGGGGGSLSFRGESQSTSTVVSSGQYLRFNGTAGINTISGIVSGIPTLEISVDNSIVTLTKSQTLENKTLEDPRIKAKLSSYYVTLRSSDLAAANYTLTLPTSAGTSGQYLKTTGSGVLAWDTPAGFGGGSLSITADTGGSASLDLSSETFKIAGGVGIDTDLSFSSPNRIITVSVDRNIFGVGSNLSVSTPGNIVVYSLNSTINDVTINRAKFQNIYYEYGDISGSTGPLYTLMDSNWDETSTDNDHLVGQLVLVPVPTV